MRIAPRRRPAALQALCRRAAAARTALRANCTAGQKPLQAALMLHLHAERHSFTQLQPAPSASRLVSQCTSSMPGICLAFVGKGGRGS